MRLSPKLEHNKILSKTMIPDLELEMKPETKYAEELIGFEFKPASGALVDAGKSVVRLGLV